MICGSVVVASAVVTLGRQVLVADLSALRDDNSGPRCDVFWVGRGPYLSSRGSQGFGLAGRPGGHCLLVGGLVVRPTHRLRRDGPIHPYRTSLVVTLLGDVPCPPHLGCHHGCLPWPERWCAVA